MVPQDEVINVPYLCNFLQRHTIYTTTHEKAINLAKQIISDFYPHELIYDISINEFASFVLKSNDPESKTVFLLLDMLVSSNEVNYDQETESNRC